MVRGSSRLTRRPAPAGEELRLSSLQSAQHQRPRSLPVVLQGSAQRFCTGLPDDSKPAQEQ